MKIANFGRGYEKRKKNSNTETSAEKSGLKIMEES